MIEKEKFNKGGRHKMKKPETLSFLKMSPGIRTEQDSNL